MKFDKQTVELISGCLTKGIPFALFSLPGSESFQFAASPLSDQGEEFRNNDPALLPEGDCFFISFYGDKEKFAATVPFILDREATLYYIASLPTTEISPTAPAIHPSTKPTTRKDYHLGFKMIQEGLAETGGKTVLSRNRVFFTDKKLKEILEEYFSLCPSTFRFLVSTPQTGVWLGGSPELLLDMERGTSFRTIALAGTRKSDEEGPWDEKNSLEHEMVVDYIVDSLNSFGLKVNVGERGEKSFITLSHLFTPISAEGVCDPIELLRRLSPTPAVCGFPVESARKMIERAETHSRYCYGGFIGVREADTLKAYVTLRSIFIEPAGINGRTGLLVNLFTGGGILPQSEEEAEWLETESKGVALAKILSRGTQEKGTELTAASCEDYHFLPWTDSLVI